MTNKREEYVKAIQRDYPNLHRWFIDMCLEIYEKDSEWFKKQKIKFDKLQKKKKGEEEVKEVQTIFKNIEIKEDPDVIKVEFN